MRQVRPGTPYPRRTRQKVAANRGRGWLLVFLLFVGLLSALAAFPTFVILACGLTPAAVSGLINNRKGHSTFACVLATNLCGVAPAVVKLWSNGNTLDGAISLLTDPYVWLVMYGSAAIGWGLLWASAEIVEIALTLIDNDRIRKLQNYQRKLIAEWGPGVAGASEPSNLRLGPAGKARA